MYAMIVGLLLIVILLVKRNKALTRENWRLKQNNTTTVKTNNQILNVNIAQESINNEIREEIIMNPVDNNIKEKNIKNNLILIAGSFLIVLSAIIFLLTSWDVVNDYIKTLTITLMFFVFLGVSKLADVKMHLKETSKAFFYISFSYLPIVLFSVSLFKLLGNYLSIYGEGKYIYFFVSSIFLASVYYIVSKQKKSSLLYYFSLLFQTASVVFLVLTVTYDINIIIMCVLLYNLVLSITLKKDTDKRFIVTSLIMLLSTILYIMYNYFAGNIDLINIISLLLILITVNIVYTENVRKAFNPIIIILIFLNIAINIYTPSNKMYLIEITMLIAYFIIFVIDLIKNKTISLYNYIITTIFCVLLSPLSFNETSIGTFMYLLSFTFITTLVYLYNKKESISIILALLINISLISFIFEYSLKDIYCLIFSLLLLSFSLLYKCENMLMNSLRKTSIIVSIIFSFLLCERTIIFSVIAVLISIIYILYYKKNKKYEILSYLYSTFSIFILMLTLAKKELITEMTLPYFICTLLGIITYFYYRKEKRDFYKFILYLLGFIISLQIISDIKVKLTLIRIIPYYILSILTTRTILKKHFSEYKIFEYSLYTLLNIISMFMYNSKFDGLLVVFLLVLFVILGYSYKYGPLFLISLIFIIINLFLLTISFWALLPWWIYALIFGLILVCFAVINERNDNNERIKEKINEIKENIDL